MAGENFKVIHGRLTHDPELTTGNRKDGKEWAKATFSVAVNNSYPSEDSSFYDCYIFGERARAICKFFKKGSEIIIFGEHQQEPYTEKEGKVKRPWKFKVSNFDFCGSGKKSDENTAPEGLENQEDIPF